MSIAYGRDSEQRVVVVGRQVARLVTGIVAGAALAWAAIGCSSPGEGAANDPTATGTTVAPQVARDATAGQSTPPAATPEPLPPSVQSLLEATARVRGLPVPANLRAELLGRAEAKAKLTAALTDDDRRWFRQTTTLYRLMGYLRSDEDYESIYLSLAEGPILGFYDPAVDTLYVIVDDPSTGFGELREDDRVTLVHELVHAIQDAAFALDVVTKSLMENLDRSLAYTAVVEGDARTHERLVPRTAARLSAGAGPRLIARAGAPQVRLPAPIERELYWPYTAGADWIAGVKARGGTAAIDALLRQPPGGTWQVLHRDRPESWQPSSSTIPDLAVGLGVGWVRESGGTFGEFQWGNFLQQRLRALDATKAAADWAGDSYAVYVRGPESVATFRIRGVDGSAGLRRALEDWLDASGARVASNGGTTVALLNDGRTFALRDASAGDTLVTVGSSESLAREAMAALIGG
jgi:hypothetical protein